MNTYKFSVFNRPIFNKVPEAEVTLQQVYKYVTTNAEAKAATEKLRSINNVEFHRRFKEKSFRWAMFSGTFSRGDTKHLIAHSGLMVVDFDHVGSLDEVRTLKEKLISDEELDVLLAFTSPSGDGLKIVIPVGATDVESHKQWFKAVQNYIKQTYNVAIDKCGSDISRPCFLPYDKDAYINKKVLNID